MRSGFLPIFAIENNKSPLGSRDGTEGAFLRSGAHGRDQSRRSGLLIFQHFLSVVSMMRMRSGFLPIFAIENNKSPLGSRDGTEGAFLRSGAHGRDQSRRSGLLIFQHFLRCCI